MKGHEDSRLVRQAEGDDQRQKNNKTGRLGCTEKQMGRERQMGRQTDVGQKDS